MKVYRVNFMHCVYYVPILNRSYLWVFSTGLVKVVVLIDCKDAFLRPAEEGPHSLSYDLFGWDIPEVSEGYIKFVVLLRLAVLILGGQVEEGELKLYCILF